MARDPPGVVFVIGGNSVTPYAITAKALEPGVYHVHTQLNVANVGPGLGPGTTVVVEGETNHKTNSICNACISECYDCSCICSNICYKTLASNLTNKTFFSF